MNRHELTDVKESNQQECLPTSRQCFSIRRDNATFSPISVQAGDVSWIFARSALTLSTRPPVEVEPILIRSSSFFTSFVTFVCFLSSLFTPSSRRSKNKLISRQDFACAYEVQIRIQLFMDHNQALKIISQVGNEKETIKKLKQGVSIFL